LYSIEEICDAMIAASAAADAKTELELVRRALESAGNLLDVSCSVFYPSPSSSSNYLGTVRVNKRAGDELETPQNLPNAFSDHLRRQSGRTIVSNEWDALGRLLPAFDFASSSSLWISAVREDRTLGTVALFDHVSRRFDRTQQKIAELFVNVLALGLDHRLGGLSKQSADTGSYQQVSKIVGIVARDLINPLTALFGYVELLKAESPEGRSAHLVARMEEQIEKARRVIADYSSWSESGNSQPDSTATETRRREIDQPRPPVVRRREHLASTPMWQPVSDEGSGARILLVQRSEAVLEFQRSVLSALGAEVIPALSANDALDQLRAKELDAIILDDDLEDALSSKKLVWWVRENRPELADRMLLTVSRKPTAETREILEIAMLPHITKPLEVLELYSRAQQVLRSGRNPHLLQ
jgi:CheY-like chemotaxis protein